MRPGVYLDLPEDVYFAAPALGSSDIKRLLREPYDWWYSSRHNPFYVEPSRGKHLIRGSALHAIMLEGLEAYESRFAVEPDPVHFPGALRTSDEIRELLSLCEITVSSKAKKQDLVDAAVQAGLGDRVWDHIVAEHQTRCHEYNLQPVTASMDRALRDMANLALELPALAAGLQSGIPEVSIFWRRDDVPDTLFRARLDSVSLRMTIDLKTLSNWKGRTVSDMPRRQIEEFEYDIQRRYYDEARQKMREFVDLDEVYLWQDDGFSQGLASLNDDMQDKLRTIAANPHWIWMWLFYQMRDDASGKAPILIPRFHQPEGDVWDQAGKKVDKAIANYVDLVGKFGLETPWHYIDEAIELEDRDLANLQYKAVI